MFLTKQYFDRKGDQKISSAADPIGSDKYIRFDEPVIFM